MKVKWLIEDGVFPEKTTLVIVQTLANIGVDYSLLSDVTKEIHKVTQNDFYIPYGSVSMVQRLLWQVGNENFGIWYNPESLSWGAISKHWNKYVLNSDSEVVRLGEFRDKLPYFYDRFGKEINGQKVLFIKPFENDKSFTGMILLDITAEGTLDNLIIDDGYFERVNSGTIIVVSRPKIVLNEWRFFILNGKIIASTQYNKNRVKHYEEGCYEPKAIELVAKVIRIWEPDHAYSLDVCESEGECYVMEIGCINCSDLYAANKVDFFGKITEAFNQNEA